MNRSFGIISFFLVVMIMVMVLGGQETSGLLANDAQSILEHHGIIPAPGGHPHRFLRRTCHRPSDCPHNASCDDGNCDCHMGFLWNSKFTECTLAQCTTDADCLEWDTAVCKKSECVCGWSASLDNHQVNCQRFTGWSSLLVVGLGVVTFSLGMMAGFGCVKMTVPPLKNSKKDKQSGTEMSTLRKSKLDKSKK